MAARVLPQTTLQDAVRALAGSYVDWALGNPNQARFMYQGMALELGQDRAAWLQTRAELKRPVFDHIRSLAEDDEVRRLPQEALSVLLLGPSHDACRQLLAGAELDTGWLRDTLPEVAWQAAQIVSALRSRCP